MNKERYQRQIILPEVGQAGQERLLASKVLCIGAGGLGSPVLAYLAAAGIGTIGIIDHDTVELRNLQRQILYTENDVGKPKVVAAKNALLKINSAVHINPYFEKFSASNSHLISEYDLIIDGLDNFATRYLINDACCLYSKPMVYGSLMGFEAQLSVFCYEDGPCYRCLYGEPPKTAIPNCQTSGILGPVAGLAGTLQASEAIKILLGKGGLIKPDFETLSGKLLVINSKSMSFLKINIPKNKTCPVCSLSKNKIKVTENAPVCTFNQVKSVRANELGSLSEYCLIDVREKVEHDANHIPNSILIPLGELENQLTTLDKNKSYLLYCAKGYRSAQAAERFLAHGFKNVAHLEGGIETWVKN